MNVVYQYESESGLSCECESVHVNECVYVSKCDL